MKGFLKVEAVEDGITCETSLADVSLMNRVDILQAVAAGLELRPWMIEMFLDMWRTNKLPELQKVDDHPPKPCAMACSFKDILKEVFGGES